jgi:hypothetical protein
MTLVPLGMTSVVGVMASLHWCDLTLQCTHVLAQPVYHTIGVVTQFYHSCQLSLLGSNAHTNIVVGVVLSYAIQEWHLTFGMLTY